MTDSDFERLEHRIQALEDRTNCLSKVIQYLCGDTQIEIALSQKK